MAVPANAAVRESRRKATAQEWERMNVLKALTAAEHSRRQFILNFAASRDTALLVPGHKADAVKAAEEWVAVWFSQSGYDRVDNEFFKYTVDARLWATHVGDDLDFPFTFMRGKADVSARSSDDTTQKSPRSGPSLFGSGEVDTHREEVTPVATPTKQLCDESPRGHFWGKQQQRHSVPLPSKSRRQGQSAQVTPDKPRSTSLASIDDLRESKERSPFFARLGRSWTRRLSAAA